MGERIQKKTQIKQLPSGGVFHFSSAVAGVTLSHTSQEKGAGTSSYILEMKMDG